MSWEAGQENLPPLGVQLPERMASYGIMGAQLRATLKPLGHQGTIIPHGLNRSLQ